LVNKKFMVVCLMVLFCPSFAGAVEVFSLKKSIEYGLEHSPVLKGGEIKIDQADMDIKSQRGRFFPSVTTGYSHSQIFSEHFAGQDSDYLDQKNNTANLRISQALFTGFENKSRFERAKLGREYQKAGLDVQKLDLAYNIKALFFELLKKRYDLSAISQRIKRLESDLSAARAFSDNKMVPYVYVLQAEADLEDAKQTLWQTETAIYKHSARLKSVLGIFRDKDLIEFNDDFEVPVYAIDKDLDSCMDKAFSTRPEILLLDLQTNMAKKDADILRARYLPQVSLDLSLADIDKSYENRADDKYTYWNAGVSVQMNLFDGGTAYYEKRRYLLEMNRLETEKNKLKMEIEEEVGVAFNSLKETRKRLVSVEKALAASQENYARQKKSFHARIATISELLDAQTMLAMAESAKSQTLLDGQMFMSALFHAMGVEQGSFGQIKPELDK